MDRSILAKVASKGTTHRAVVLDDEKLFEAVSRQAKASINTTREAWVAPFLDGLVIGFPVDNDRYAVVPLLLANLEGRAQPLIDLRSHLAQLVGVLPGSASQRESLDPFRAFLVSQILSSKQECSPAPLNCGVSSYDELLVFDRDVAEWKVARRWSSLVM